MAKATPAISEKTTKEYRVIATEVFASDAAIKHGTIFLDGFAGDTRRHADAEGIEQLSTDSLDEARELFDRICATWRSGEDWPDLDRYDFGIGGVDYWELTLVEVDPEYDEYTILDRCRSFPDNVDKLFEEFEERYYADEEEL